ncbi:hypothetical protein T11_6704 [Trichinella zimbabwensis]|uniref:Uncharacterized protein n=1 Tax=Trichinella zimbabwensis TaxID=268475 RepID=A0A0V1GXJ4_9BILA|nr:hypothetical protein T11_6704 [Trichinella zimbabwensis]
MWCKMLPASYPYVCITTEQPPEKQQQQDLKQLISEFLSIFDGVCRPVKGPPCHLKLTNTC